MPDPYTPPTTPHLGLPLPSPDAPSQRADVARIATALEALDSHLEANAVRVASLPGLFPRLPAGATASTWMNTGALVAAMAGDGVELSLDGVGWSVGPVSLATGAILQFRFAQAVIDGAGHGDTLSGTLTVDGKPTALLATIDKEPSAVTFTPKTGQNLGSVVAADSVVATGFNARVKVWLASTQSSVVEAQIAGGGWVNITGVSSAAASSVWLAPGETIAVRHNTGSAPATTVTTTISIGGVEASFGTTTANQAVAQPAITNPLTGTTGVERTVLLTCTAYAVINGLAETHASTDWQIATDGSFSSILTQRQNDAVNKTSWYVAAGHLVPSTAYFVRVRHRGSGGSVSAWSPTVTFSTDVSFTDTSALLAIIHSPSNPSGTWSADGLHVKSDGSKAFVSLTNGVKLIVDLATGAVDRSATFSHPPVTWWWGGNRGIAAFKWQDGNISSNTFIRIVEVGPTLGVSAISEYQTPGRSVERYGGHYAGDDMNNRWIVTGYCGDYTGTATRNTPWIAYLGPGLSHQFVKVICAGYPSGDDFYLHGVVPYGAGAMMLVSGTFGNPATTGIGLIVVDGSLAAITTNRKLVASTSAVRDWALVDDRIWIILGDDTILVCDNQLNVLAARKLDGGRAPRTVRRKSSGVAVIAYTAGATCGVVAVANATLTLGAGTLLTGFATVALNGQKPSYLTHPANMQWVVGAAAGGYRSQSSAMIANVNPPAAPMPNHPGVSLATDIVTWSSATGGTASAGPFVVWSPPDWIHQAPQGTTIWSASATPLTGYDTVLSEVG